MKVWAFCSLAALCMLGALHVSAEEPPVAADAGAAPAGGAGTPSSPWCAAELETLPGDVCLYTPPGEPTKVLVIFLHGVVKPDTTWQWTQQRALVRYAKVHHFTVLLPRGRRGVGTGELHDLWTWPNAAQAQKTVEQSVLDEWKAAQALLEERRGAPFERVYVFGFSAGAYYASSLALRDRVKVDGYAVFAGGAAPKHLNKGALPRHRPPIFVGYGRKDPAFRDPDRFAKALRSVGWKCRLDVRRSAGHTIVDDQVKNAFAFFDSQNSQARKGRPEADAAHRPERHAARRPQRPK